MSATPLLITYDNKPDENTHRFVRTLKAHAWEHIMLGEGDVWEGWSTRMKAYRSCLAALPDDKVVILSDARDVICVRGSKAFMKAYASYKKDIVVCMELTCGGKFDVPDDFNCVQCVPLARYWKFHGITEQPRRKFVNNGLLAGTVRALRELLEWSIANGFVDDQLALGSYVNAFPDRVALDVEAHLLHTTSFGFNAGIQSIHVQKHDSPTFAELFGRGAFFLHMPGSSGKGQSVVYNTVAKFVDGGIHDRMLREPYGYAEPEWDEVF
jgi:hypothetical protein